MIRTLTVLALNAFCPCVSEVPKYIYDFDGYAALRSPLLLGISLAVGFSCAAIDMVC